MRDSRFSEVRPEDLGENVFTLIGSDWMLVAAGTPDAGNAMTASWGGFGVLWGRDVCFCFIRPQRYTYRFMEERERFTLSFFDETYRKALELFGSRSGRETDKAAAAGLTRAATPRGDLYFSEARLVVECRKVYWQDIDPAHFLDPSIAENYAGGDYHRMYAGEILACRARSG